MSVFFIRTDRSVAGPFTGIELREAALAGILGYDAIISGSAEGPWFQACDVGLFSDQKTPLPHPAGTIVPHYQVRGMPGAFQGPFKLRELIGLAARGMLPADALLQSNRCSDWIPVRRIHMLSACLDGELVLIDGSGHVVLRTAAASDSSAAVDITTARAPIEVAQSVGVSDATTIASATSGDEVDASEWSWGSEESADESPPGSVSRWARLWPRLPRLQGLLKDLTISIRPRLVMQLVCLLLLFAGAASAFSFWKQIGLKRNQVIGDWIGVAAAPSEFPPFGLSLRADGKCVLFNTEGDSWTGDFDWEERSDDQSGFESLSPFSTQFDEVSSRHQRGIVLPTDGYVRLQGFVKDPPVIDGHPVRDLFLRRDRDRLRIGYISSVHWTRDAKTVEAGWIDATAAPISQRDIAVELRSLPKDLRVPKELFGGELPMHLSEAIDAVRLGIPAPHDPNERMLHECLTYSATVTSGYLLANYGLPDEARRIYRFEIPQLRNGPSFAGAQVVRYGEFKFVFTPAGKLLYLVLVQRI